MGGKQQIDAKNSNFQIFESTLYMKSVRMPLITLIDKRQTNKSQKQQQSINQSIKHQRNQHAITSYHMAGQYARKAFDIVYHNSLLRKLHLAGIDGGCNVETDSWYSNA